MDDKKIVKLLWQRAESALQAMAKKYGRRLMSIAMNILGVPQDAEETVNDTYLAVWNTVPPKAPDPLSGYVYTTGRNLSLGRLMHNNAQKRNSRYDVSIDELANCIPTAALEDSVDARALGEAINRFVNTLSADNRALFLRRYWFGDPVQQIAKDLGMRPNTATVRLGRLRASLHEHLIKEGYLDE